MLVVAGPWMLGQLVDLDRASSTADPEPGGRMMTPSELLAQFGEQQVAGFFLVLARVSPLFVARAAVPSQD